MFSKLKTAAVLAAAGAAGGPYVASETEWGRQAMTSISSMHSGDRVSASTSVDASLTGYANHAHHEVENLRRANADKFRYDEQLAKRLGGSDAPNAANTRLAGVPVKDLREVMRFDITPDWLTQRFSRVSTVLADTRLEGIRVPIVTGTRADDLAGTLTYYFDRTQRLQRITLHGFTGDPNRLVGTMTQYYGMVREPSLDGGVFTKRWNGEPVHLLRMTRAPIVYVDAIHQKYTVFMELNQPNLAFGISPEARRIVASDRMSGRW